MQNIHLRILHIIKQILNNKNILIKNIEIITEKEKIKILNNFNNNILTYPKQKTIVDLFEEQVKQNPNNIAVVFNEDKLTYKELNYKANSLANYFINIGIKKGDIIPAVLNRTTDLIISMLAIIKVGGVYLPISPEIPIDRINFILKNCKAKFAITESNLNIEKNIKKLLYLKNIKNINNKKIFFSKNINNTNIKKIKYFKNKNEKKINNSKNNKNLNIINIKEINYLNFNKNNLNIKISPNDLLYIIYTSGSTGNPKGVKVCHKNLVNFIYSFTHMYGDISTKDKLLASTNISFDVSIFEFYISLLNGCSLYLYDEQNINDIYKYCNCIIKNKITFAYIAPNLLDIVYNILSKSNTCSLNKLLIGVEPIKHTTIKKYYSINENMKIINAYGPTEATICATAILLNKNIINKYKIIPIGKPLNNLQIFILDKNLMPVPTNTIGEIYIAGDNVSKGYLNNKELTNKSFVSLPNFNCNYAYKTGDLAKWDDNGIINFIGRNDNQVKINGHRIELGEIEACIYSYPNIHKAIVLLNKNNKIICYFSSNKKINITNLKNFITKKLPTYYIPNFFMQVNTFELTSNGKIDRNKLPEIKYEDLKKDIISPRNNIDSKLIEFLEDLLKIHHISIDDSFFDLGGDSLSAINLCVKIQNEFNVQILVKDILEKPKVQDLSDIISKNIAIAESQTISQEATCELYPVSLAQNRIYFASKASSNSSVLYNISGSIILNGNIDSVKLEKCFNILINRHESLRTCFEIYKGNVVQRIINNIDFKLNILNKENFDNLNYLFTQFIKPFDLSKAPLFRAQFVSFTNGKSAIFLSLHKIIADNKSMSILVNELCKLYNDEDLPKLTISYKDFAVFENNDIDFEKKEKAENYWISQFSKEIPVLSLPIKHTNTPQSFEGARTYFSINKALTTKLEKMAKSLELTPYELLLSVYYILLSKYTTQYDIVIGALIDNRNIPETCGVIGEFENILALRKKIDTYLTFKDFALNVKKHLAEAFEYHTYSFYELINKLNLKIDDNKNHLFNTMFIYNDECKKIHFNNIKAEYYIPDNNISKFDLSLEAILTEGEIRLSFEYAKKLFDENFIKNLSKNYLNILKIILENINIKLNDIEIICENKELNNISKTKIDYTQNFNTAENYNNTISNYPLSSAQKRIYLASQLAGKSSILYNISGGIILEENIDLIKLENCFNILINRHEALRTYFEIYNENVVQKIAENINFKLQIANNENFDNINILFKDFVKPFDLTKPPLFRAKYLSFTNGKSAIFLDTHHIISDGMSISILVDELCRLYNNESLPKLHISYKDFAILENSKMDSEKMKQAEDYWVSQFEGEIPVLNLPIKEPRPSIQSFEGAKVYSFINENLTNKLKDLSKTLGVTPYMLLLSAYYVLLSKYTSQNDIIVGSPVAGRNSEKTYNVIGMFVNTLALREKINSSLSFKDFVLNVKNNLLKAYNYQSYPFDELVKKLKIKKDASRNPLFDTMFIYQNNGYQKLNFKNIKSEYYIPDTKISKFDLSLEAVPTENEIRLSFEYATKLFEKNFIINLSENYLNILKIIFENIDIKISDINILSEEEKNKIIYKFNNTQVAYKKNKTISVLFEEQVKKTPNNIALVFENKALTYKELNEKANSLAYYLRNIGICKNDLIGIMVNRSLEMIISILAVLKAGAAYIPIDPTYPKDRIEYMLNNSNSKLLLTQKNLENKIDFKNKIFVNLEQTEIYSLPNENLKNINTPKDLSYIIYTSGSTGAPKGVMLTHKALSNLTNYCNNYIDYLKEPEYRAIASITTMSFDIFIFETLISLQKGLKLIIANEDEQSTPKLLNNLIEKNNVKIIQSTPSRMQIFINNINELPALKNLDFITLAGEQLPLSLVKTLQDVCNCVVYNGYGPSETTVFSTLTKMDGKIVTIGKPLYNTQIYILNNNLQPTPIGVTGEIYISGDGVGKGYLNNVELTNKSFMQNPFVKDTIMYKTGDLGMYTNEGSIICFGRSDNQIKIRGQRIELGEIEELLLKIPFINSCSVVKSVDENSHEFLCAYFTANKKINVKNIKENLEAFLPKYMIPQYYMQLDNLPYTPNGKIDKKKLPKIEYEKKEFILPRNEIDYKLINILKKLLKINKISINDSFFEIGLDSLSAISLCVIIENELNSKILVTDILENPTVEKLSDIISKNTKSIEKSNISIAPKKEYYPVSSAQRRMYFSSEVSGISSVLYNISGGIILNKNINTQKLENCFNILINRHESLRTYFVLNSENVVQKVLNNINFKLDILNNEKFDNLDNLFKDFVKPFDLSKAPLFRTKYISFTNGKSAIFLDIHHIISDGTSLNILIDELCQLYNNEALPELKISYKDFAVYENDSLDSGKFIEAENYWVSQFSSEIPVLNLPTNHQRPAVQSFEGKKVYSVINKSLTEKINSLSDSLNITPYMLLLSAYYILLSKYTFQNDIVVGSPVIGRNNLETYNLIGMFVNTLALREKVDDSLAFKDFVLSVKNHLLKAYDFQTYPFDELVGKLNLKRDISRNPLFDTMFIYQNNGYKKLNFDNIKSEYYVPDTGISKFDLSLEAIPIDGEIKLSFEYATVLFDEEFIKNLSEHYLNILKVVLKNIDIKIANINILSLEEKNKIIYEFNNTKVDYPRNKTISILFEEQVLKTPNNIALVFGEQKLTYKELNEKANSLALYLRNNGIGRNDFVGIMVNRSLEMIVSILAVLKAGAAYIPIDPSFPKDRVEYMLNNSKSKTVLTQLFLEEKINYKNKIIVDLDNEKIYSLPNENIENINEPEDLAYVIFTSGSTGLPKGVMITHKVLSNFTNYCNNYVEYLKDNIYRGIISITTISFDIFAYETIISLQKGLKVIIANENEQTTPTLLNNLIKNTNAEIIQSTPSIMQIFVNNLSNIPELKNLKYITLAGEQLPLTLVQALHKICNCVIYNGYGPSETYYCSLTKMNNDIITIGKPIYNSQMYILDKHLNPVPIGITGEIYISGECVGNGYLNNSELTKKSFIKNPFLPNTIMYKSGDLGLYTTDGNIICLGRTDHQIKIRGLRIELGEIEALIEKYPNIVKVVVIKQSINSREFISAYYVQNKKIIVNELRKYLSKSLPKYMVPSYYTALDDFPYTPNGKIDRKALPLPTEILNMSSENYVAPQTNVQKKLVHIWEKILNTTPIGINDNFFELGGDSLLAMNLIIELLKISTKVEYSDIFRYPTISELAEKINSDDNKPFLGKIENLSNTHIRVLKNCTKKDKIAVWHPNNILLTGSTGFLGIHILEQFLNNEKGKIYCIVRDAPGVTAKTRLHEKLNYYFGNKYDDLLDNRIIVINGDTSKPNFGLNQKDLLEVANSIDVVLNSAANVFHFGNYNSFYNSNVVSVKYMIEFCKSFNKKLYHISTTGIAGTKLDTTYLATKRKIKKGNVICDEAHLYVGQVLDNVYTRSKFEAEKLLLDSIGNGLDGYILRIGHLMPRYSDGVFQENILDNEFMQKCVSFVNLGIIPNYLLSLSLDITPVDFTAIAIYKLVTHPSNNNKIFHLYNQHFVCVNRYLKLFKKLGYNLSVLNEKDFKEKINILLKDDNKKNLLNNLIRDFDDNFHLDYNIDVKMSSKFSIKYLKRLNFRWPKITNKYILKFISLLRKVI